MALRKHSRPVRELCLQYFVFQTFTSRLCYLRFARMLYFMSATWFNIIMIVWSLFFFPFVYAFLWALCLHAFDNEYFHSLHRCLIKTVINKYSCLNLFKRIYILTQMLLMLIFVCFQRVRSTKDPRMRTQEEAEEERGLFLKLTQKIISHYINNCYLNLIESTT